MKNKIVKALVLASIVSMTATGAAGLTFADDDVTTGDTATTSTEATTTTKTVDQLAEALTEAQEDAATKEAAFTKANEDYEAAKTAADAVGVGYDKAVQKQEKAIAKASDYMTREALDVHAKLQEMYTTAEQEADQKPAAKTAKNNLDDLFAKYRACYEARDTYDKALGAFKPDELEGKELTDAKNNLESLKTKFETAFKNFKEALKKVTDDDYIKTLDQYEDLLQLIEREEEETTAYDAALSELAKLKDERSKIDKEEADDRVFALETAERTLKKATKNYNTALANVKTAKEDYTTATKDLVPVFRVFHPGTMEHLYTTGAHERDVLVEKGWKDEKVAWLTVGKDAEDAAPVYRLCYPGTGDHHYTTDKNERDTLIKTQGWIDETVAFYVPKKGDASVYRVYLSSLKIGAHHFTTGRNEYDTLVQNGWRPEGVSFEVSAKDWIDVSGIKTEDERIAKVAKALNIAKDLGIEG